MSSNPMKKVITNLLVSMSLFSILFSYKLWFSHPLFALPIQLVSHAFDKSYIFLICNGIVLLHILVAKTSSASHVAPSRPPLAGPEHDDLQTPPVPLHAKVLDYSLLHKETSVENCVFLLENADPDDNEELEEEEEEKHVIEEMKEDNEQEAQGDDDDNDDDDDEEEVNNGVFMEVEKEVEEERERLNKLSTEELNKKFEDFIKKMKQDIRIEVQQQHLVLVK